MLLFSLRSPGQVQVRGKSEALVIQKHGYELILLSHCYLRYFLHGRRKSQMLEVAGLVSRIEKERQQIMIRNDQICNCITDADTSIEIMHVKK